MTPTQAAQDTARAVAKVPTDVLVAAIQTIRNSLDAVEAVANSGLSSGEKAADELLAAVQTSAPSVVDPLLKVLHLQSQNTEAK